MSFVELFFVAVGLSADAFAVALADGLNLRRRRKAVLIAFMFGLFQAMMPIIGYLFGSGFAHLFSSFDHYLALAVLGFIGGKMITESIRELAHEDDDEPPKLGGLTFPALLAQSAATAIDALMVGVSFAAIRVSIAPAALFIGAVTFVLSLLGALGGRRLGLRFGAKAELAGGIVLAVIGIKTFIEHIAAGI
ncbi:MAG: manganese efflux pump MntP family protein [Oscillospiraceae bacterium]|nr:manganese efflux pump MntP family protein [Oscillospiraceae bacterium]